ncbi:YidC/Oxa1 family membrane protein insertase [Microvirga flocculans]|uniref:Membrane protein insertase YidC n=1 Tax=Microvirga flocculans TaxID=217168 RepID=A0A7W6N707_9HYPH|nr:membrane protein insertase YidC [Microvirga flocculans]MBB4038955.1 YidC/Oxa1 family membrane protein insertase [Microvirga flocculans]
MREDNKNLIVAIALSLAVLLGWQYFFAAPQAEKQRQAAQQQQSTQANPTAPNPPASPSQAGGAAPTVPGTVPSTPAAPAVETREAALARSPRVAIDTPAISGSINLRGGRIDDVALKNYRETVDPKSANIVLLSPAGTQNPYYAEFGWVGAQAGSLPGPNTVWTADKTSLTPGSPVTLTWQNDQGLVFQRTVSVDEKFMFTVKDTVENRGSAPVSLQAYGLVSRHGKPVTLGYYVLHEGMIGVVGENGLQEIKYDALDKETPVAGSNVSQKTWDGVKGGFLGITDKYWAAAIIPDQATPYQGTFASQQSQAGRTYNAVTQVAAQTVQPGGSFNVTQHLFAGAKEVATIDAYQSSLNIDRFDRLIDWGWFYFITKHLFMVLDFFYKLFGNFGIAILLVTVILKILFFPLANKSYASMAKMKAVQPEMTSIRERYADDKMKQQQALMELYRKEKINPVAGCWPVLIQIPVFFALYKVLFVTIEMRHAPFFGWIRDLAAPDPTSIFNLFGLLPYNPGAVPVIGHFLMLGVWPILMGITMWLQMKMNPEPPDPVQKQVFSWMPVIFTFMLGSFPAGLVIYWAWNNLLSVTQQAFIMRRNGVKIELWDNLRKTFSRKASPAKG